MNSVKLITMLTIILSVALFFNNVFAEDKEIKKVDLLEKDVNDLTKEDMAKLMIVMETNHGTIKFKFFPNEAPETCRNFIKLTKAGFYNGLTFHRIIKNFMIQGGCPKGTGTGDPGYKIKAEFNKNPHIPGAVSMARAQHPDSAGCQFFICHAKHQRFLDGKYTVFGQVFEGQDVVDKIANVETLPGDKPKEKVEMKKVSVELLEEK